MVLSQANRYVALALAIALGAPACATTGRARWPQGWLQGLITRDGLEAPGEESRGWVGQRVFMEWRWADLDGQRPHELVLRVDEVLGPERVSRTLHAYSIVDRSDPRLLWSHTGGPEGRAEGWIDVRDMDGDGREEVVAAGAPVEGGGVSRLRILGGVEGGRDRVWGEDSGRDYALFDHDGDGQVEVLSLTDGGVRVLASTGGYWREISPRRPIGTWLPRAYTAVAQADAPRRAQLELLARALRARGLEPARLEAVTRALITLRESSNEDDVRALALRGMAWPGDESARAYARAVRLDEAGDAEVAAARGLLAVVGDETDRTRLFELLRAAWLGDEAGLDAPWVVETLRGFDRVRDVRAARALVGIWTSPGLTQARRQALGRLVRRCDACAEEAAAKLSVPMDAAAREELWGALLAGMLEGSEAWRRALSAKALEERLTARDATERERAATALGAYGDARAAAALDEVVALDPETGVRHAAARSLARLEAWGDGARRVASLERTSDPFEQAALHELLVHADEEWMSRALASAARAGHIRPYADALAHGPARRGPLWEPAASAMATLALQSPSHDVRLQATRALGGLDTQTSRDALRDVTTRELDASVRARAVASLRRLEPARELDRWLSMWAREHDAEVLRELAHAMARTRDPGARAALEGALGEPARATASVRALGSSLSDDGARRFIAHAFAEEGCAPSEDAIAALVSVGHPLAPGFIEAGRVRPGCDPTARLTRWLDEAARSPSDVMRSFAKRHRASRSREVRVAAQRALDAHTGRD